jgi:hypothetical protein
VGSMEYANGHFISVKGGKLNGQMKSCKLLKQVSWNKLIIT